MLSRFGNPENTFALMEALWRRMDRPWDDSDPSWQGSIAGRRALSAPVFPRVNVYDAGSDLVLKADVPGLTQNDVEITIEEGTLVIAGERKLAPFEGYTPARLERSGTRFSRSLQLPCKVDSERTTASVKDGVLTVTLAKAAEAQPRQIAVRVQ